VATLKGYEFPDDLYYHKEHAWARIEDDGTVTVGMTDFAQESAGEIMYVDLPEPGDEVEVGGTCAKIQTAKWIGKLQAPVSGEIIEINEDLTFESEIINESPYDKGWFVKIQPSNLEADKAELMVPSDPAMEKWLEGEIARVEAEKKAKSEED